MKVGQGRVICAVAMVVALFAGQTVGAVDAGGTTFLASPPLLITSYQTKDGGKDLQYIELFNTSKSMVRVEDWIVRDVANGRDLLLHTPYTGLLEPGSHVVASRPGVVAGASFVVDGWNVAKPVSVALTNLQIVRDGYRTLDANLSTKVDDRDKMMVRTYNTDSYSTASSPFVQNYRVAPQASLFDDGLYAAPSVPQLRIVETYPYASDCSPFDTSVLCGDYVKLYNPTTADVVLDGLVLRTDSSSASRTTSNTITLAGTVAAGGYHTVWLSDTGARLSLTNSGGYVWLEDTYGTVVYDATLAHYQSAGSSLQGFAYAENEAGSWEWTSTPMPDAANVITPAATTTCPEGKYRNPDTGRCRTLEETINALAACEEGYERNPTTNRCRKVSTASGSTLTPCKEGQERNPETNRCRSIASAVAELLPCDEGYERNPATNRCRKVRDASALSAEYPVQPYGQGASAVATWWVVGGIAALALGYAGWEWRHEIANSIARLRRAFTPRK